MSGGLFTHSEKKMKSVIERIKAGESLRDIRKDLLKEEEE